MSIEREAQDAKHPEGTTVKTADSGIALVLSCGGRTADLPLSELHDGSEVSCPCGQGVTITLSGIDDLKRTFEEVERSLDRVNRAADRIGITRPKITIG